MDTVQGGDCGRWGVGWVEEGKGGKIGTTGIEEQKKRPKYKIMLKC